MANENDVFPEQFIGSIFARSEAAQRAFNDLLRAKVNRDQLISALCDIHLNPPSERGPYLHGMSDKAAKRFPERITRFSREIQQANSGTLFYELLLSHQRTNPSGPKPPWVLDGDYRKSFKIFQDLAGILKSYATFVEFAISQKRRRPNIQVTLVVMLMKTVRLATGKPKYRQIEALLDAVFRERKQTSPYDRRQLQDLWRKTRRLITPPILSQSNLE
jgi:hypothetical protein